MHLHLVARAEGIGEQLRLGSGDPLLDLDVVVLTPIGPEVQLPNLGDQRMDRIGAGALVVEGALTHLVQAVYAGLLINTVVVEASGDVDGGLDKVIEDLLVDLALIPQCSATSTYCSKTWGY